MQLDNTFLIRVVQLLLNLLRMKFQLLFNADVASHVVFQLLQLFFVGFWDVFVFFSAWCLHLISHLFKFLAETTISDTHKVRFLFPIKRIIFCLLLLVYGLLYAFLSIKGRLILFEFTLSHLHQYLYALLHKVQYHDTVNCLQL